MEETKSVAGVWRGLPTVELHGPDAVIVVVPASGARIVSLRSVRSGREWLDQAADRMTARGAWAAPFQDGPLAGADECLPSVGPCTVHGMSIPDHGDAWSAAWEVDAAALAQQRVDTSLRLRSLPLVFRRTVVLSGPEVVLDYRIENTCDAPVPYLWAWHPLLRVEPEDRVAFRGPRRVHITATGGTALQEGQSAQWPDCGGRVQLDRWSLGDTPQAYLKAFVPTGPDGAVEISNGRTGAALRLHVDPSVIPAWGYWRAVGGAYYGHSQAALEPTSGAADRLDEIAGDAAATLAARESKAWRLRLEMK